MAFDLTKLIGFNFNGLEVDNVVIDTSVSSSTAQTYAVNPGFATTGTQNGFLGNNSDTGFTQNDFVENVTAASNGTSIDGSPLRNPKALGQIVYNDIVNGAPSPSVTLDVLGYSADGGSILTGFPTSYSATNPNGDPYNGGYYIFANKNIDGNATPSLFPSTTQNFSATNPYTGGPASAGGTSADLLTVTASLVGLRFPTNSVIVVNSGAATRNADGTYHVAATSGALATGPGTFSLATGNGAEEGQQTLKYTATAGTTYYQVVGFNQTQILLQATSTTGVPTTRYSVVSFSNRPATGAVSLDFADFGNAPISGQAYPCFLGGTLIATPSGEKAIETLVAGDLVLTIAGEARAVRWLGQSAVSLTFADPVRILPIRIRAGALADNVPARDLLVSPDHALFLGGCLVQAGALVNGVTIVREADMPTVFTYYHLELDSHELILAEGAAAETFVDNIDRMSFDNWADRSDVDGEMAELPFARAKSARQVPGSVQATIAGRVPAVVKAVTIAA